MIEEVLTAFVVAVALMFIAVCLCLICSDCIEAVCCDN